MSKNSAGNNNKNSWQDEDSASTCSVTAPSDSLNPGSVQWQGQASVPQLFVPAPANMYNASLYGGSMLQHGSSQSVPQAVAGYPACPSPSLSSCSNPNQPTLIAAPQNAFLAHVPGAYYQGSAAFRPDYVSQNAGLFLPQPSSGASDSSVYSTMKHDGSLSFPVGSSPMPGIDNPEWYCMRSYQNGSGPETDADLQASRSHKTAALRSNGGPPFHSSSGFSSPFQAFQFPTSVQSSSGPSAYQYANLPPYLSAPASPMHPDQEAAGGQGRGQTQRLGLADRVQAGKGGRAGLQQSMAAYRSLYQAQQQQQQPSHQAPPQHAAYHHQSNSSLAQQHQFPHGQQGFGAFCVPTQQFSLMSLDGSGSAFPYSAAAAAAAAAASFGDRRFSLKSSAFSSGGGGGNGQHKTPRVNVDPQLKKELKVNPSELDENLFKRARYFIIKSHSTYNVEQAMQHGVWCSTSAGNEILDAAYCSMHPESMSSGGPLYRAQRRKSIENGEGSTTAAVVQSVNGGLSSAAAAAVEQEEEEEEEAGCVKPDSTRSEPGHVFLFFSVTNSRAFCGIAEMTGRVQRNASSGIWGERRWRDQFPIKWLYIKHVQNSSANHILLPEHCNKPITFMRDAAEVKTHRCAEQLFRIFHSF